MTIDLSAIGLREVAEAGVAGIASLAMYLNHKLSHRTLTHADQVLTVVQNNTEAMGELKESNTKALGELRKVVAVQTAKLNHIAEDAKQAHKRAARRRRRKPK